MTVEAELAVIIVQLQLQQPVLKYIRDGVAKLLAPSSSSTPAAPAAAAPIGDRAK